MSPFPSAASKEELIKTPEAQPETPIRSDMYFTHVHSIVYMYKGTFFFSVSVYTVYMYGGVFIQTICSCYSMFIDSKRLLPVDMRLYNKLMDDIPTSAISSKIILHCMVEQVLQHVHVKFYLCYIDLYPL